MTLKGTARDRPMLTGAGDQKQEMLMRRDILLHCGTHSCQRPALRASVAADELTHTL